MRRRIWSSCLLGIASLASCERSAMRLPIGDGVLVLEVGGEQPSLRAALSSLGWSPEAPQHIVAPAMMPPSSPASDPDRDDVRRESPRSPAGSLPAVPEVAEPSAPQWTTVTLGDGETLIQLARRHLGDGRRYVDLLKWNGWSERDARRLPRNQQVKILLGPQ